MSSSKPQLETGGAAEARGPERLLKTEELVKAYRGGGW
jgi:hypothetical protein